MGIAGLQDRLYPESLTALKKLKTKQSTLNCEIQLQWL